MKAVDYNVPWGRSSDDVITVKREVDTFYYHQSRINRAKAGIDCHNSAIGSSQLTHLVVNPKKQAIATQRHEEIERQDYHMHSRMESYVSQGSNQKKKKKRSLAKGEMVPPKSLNSHVRTKEQKRIREENKRNRERMNTLRPTSELSRSGMRKDRLQREKYLGNISRTRQKEKKIRTDAKEAHV